MARRAGLQNQNENATLTPRTISQQKNVPIANSTVGNSSFAPAAHKPRPKHANNNDRTKIFRVMTNKFANAPHSVCLEI